MSRKSSLRGSRFGGQDNSVSIIDKPFDLPEVLKDAVIYPKGRVKMRDGYSQRFSTRPEWFEGTTLGANRTLDDNIVPGLGTNAYLSQRRNCVVEGWNTSGGVQTQYIFAGLVTGKDPLEVVIYRGTVSSNGETVTWSAPFTIYQARTNALAYTGDDSIGSNQIWLEFSLAFNAARTILYAVVVDRDDTNPAKGVGVNNYGQLRVWALTDLYAAAFSPTQTQQTIDSGGTTTLTFNGNDALTHDVDIAVDSLGGVVIAYGVWSSTNSRYEIQLRRFVRSNFTTEPYVMSTAGYNLFGLKLAYNTGAQDWMVLSYVRFEIATSTQTMRITKWRDSAGNPMADGSAQQLATAPYDAGGNLRWTNGAIMCSDDTSGRLFIIYRADSTHLVYYRYVAIGDAITAASPALSTLFELENSYTNVGTLIEAATNWDIVVKGTGSSQCIFIYYVQIEAGATPGYRIRRCQSIDGAAFVLDSQYVHVAPATDHVLYLCTDRQFNSYAMRRLVFFHVDVPPVTDVTNYMFLSQEKDASLSQVSIEAMHEYPLPQTDDTAIQTVVVQCDDSRYYKRDDTMFHWQVLENTMDVNNAAESWWRRLSDTLANGGLALTQAPDPTPHSHFLDNAGSLWIANGLGSKIVPAKYQAINRYICGITNDRYQDHYLDLTPLTPPSASNLASDPNPGSAVVYPIGSSNIAGWAAYAPNDGAAMYAVGPNPHHTKYLHYRPFGLTDAATGRNWYVDQGYASTFDGEEGTAMWRLNFFFVGLSFIYDDLQESQIFPLPANAYAAHSHAQLLNWASFARTIPTQLGSVSLGFIKDTNPGNELSFYAGYIAVPLAFRSWNTATTPGNPRVTAIRIWLSEVIDKEQDRLKSVYFPAKTVIVGKREQFDQTDNSAVANGAQPAGKPWDGEYAEWDYSAPTFSLTDEKVVVIDADDVIAGQSSGKYAEINGHSDDIFDATLGLHRSPFPEAWKAQAIFNGKMLIGGIRKDGVDRQGRISSCAIRTEFGFSNLTPDVYSDENDIDLPFTFQDFGKIDDDTALVIGDRGFMVVDTRMMQIRDTFLGLGASAHDSVFETREGRSLIMFVSGNRIRMADSYSAPVFGEEIVRSSEIGTYQGIEDLSVKTDCWGYYLPNTQQALFFFRQSSSDCRIFRYDYRNKAWSRFTFADALKCGCVGVDGELFWTSAYRIFNYPSGATDNGTGINPLVISGSGKIEDDEYVDIDSLSVTYKTDASVALVAAVIRDRGQLSNLSHTLAASATVTNAYRQMNQDNGRGATREVAVQLSATAPTVFEIDDLRLNAFKKRRVV